MSSSLLTRLFLQRSIVLTFALAEFVLGIAALLACVPMGWWLRSDVFAVPEVSPVTWLAQTIRRGAAPGEPASTPASAGDAVDPAQPAASGAQPEPALSAQDQPAAQAQPPVTPGQPATPEQKGPPASPQAQPPAVTQPPSQPGVQPSAQSPAQPAGHPPAQPAEQASGQPAAQGQAASSQPAPDQSSPQAAQLNLAEQIAVEEESIESLTDVSDILRATFDDDEATDPWLAELSASLPEVELARLRAMARSLAGGLRSRRISAAISPAEMRATPVREAAR